MPDEKSIARFPMRRPGVFVSTELVLLRAVSVTSLPQLQPQFLLGQIMGFDQILERFRMVPQLGVYQTDEQMRIHALPFRKIHTAMLGMPMVFRKRRACRRIQKSTVRLHDPPVSCG
jgi:hypothetical protein